ncbi:Thioredoxin-like protein AAED1 [Nymphaea thermarum]|nr:Thioredoxin-like protein AAED1 [Nymphaea thermarum]
MAWSSIRVANSPSLLCLPLAPLPSPSPTPSSISISVPLSHRSSSIRSINRLSKRGFSLVMGASSSSSLDGFNAEEITSLTVLRADSGESVQFKDLWDQNDGVAVVALLRHFGCVCCWELASVLRDVKPRFDSAGVKLIAVGVGTPDKAQILAEKLPFPLDCLYADPDRKVYNALGLYYGLSRTFFNPASAKVFTRFDSIQKALKNYTISATPDDRSSVLQQGGMFIFKGKQLMYARKDEGTGDHAPLEDILNLCCTTPAV